MMGKKSFKYSLNTGSGSSFGQTMPNSLNLEHSRKAKALQSTEHQNIKLEKNQAPMPGTGKDAVAEGSITFSIMSPYFIYSA